MFLRRTAGIFGQDFTQLNTMDDFVIYLYSYTFQTKFSLLESVILFISSIQRGGGHQWHSGGPCQDLELTIQVRLY